MADLETQQARLVKAITDQASARLEALWSPLVGLPFDDVREVLFEVLPALSADFGDQAVAVAAEFYEDLRVASGVKGTFNAVVPDSTPDFDRWRALTLWGTQPLFRTNSSEILELAEGWGVNADVRLEPDWDGSLKRINGGLQRSIADQHRLTVMESAVADPQAGGWARYAGGGDGSCSFCSMLISRGGIYRENSAKFGAHDHCNCQAGPVWKNRDEDEQVRKYQKSARRQEDEEGNLIGSSKADSERAKQWMKDHLEE